MSWCLTGLRQSGGRQPLRGRHVCVLHSAQGSVLCCDACMRMQEARVCCLHAGAHSITQTLHKQPRQTRLLAWPVYCVTSVTSALSSSSLSSWSLKAAIRASAHAAQVCTTKKQSNMCRSCQPLDYRSLWGIAGQNNIRLTTARMPAASCCCPVQSVHG